MGIIRNLLNSIRNTKVPAPDELIAIPRKIKTLTKNQKLNSINIKYWDRHFKHPRNFIGEISHDTNIPIIYFSSPAPLAIIQFDDSTYQDEEGQTWIEVVEDYAYGLDRNSDLAQFLNVRYYNDFADGKVESTEDEKFKQYKIPLTLNRIPREIIKIDTRTYNIKDSRYVSNKMEITQNIISLLGKVLMLSRVGKKDNSFIITGVLLGGSMGVILGIIISFAFLIKN